MTNQTPDRRPAIYHDLHHNQMRRREEAIRHSAEVILSELFRRFSPRSALDVGCGMGIWLQAAQALGVADIQGIEGDWLDKNLLRIPQQHVATLDLEQVFDLGRRFDLVICLEVAEHLQPAAAGPLVESLVRHADVVLFSAAIPFQGGHHHVNEQFPDYWDRLFQRFDYRAIDFLRPIIWTNPAVLWWLRQNILVFAKRELTIDEAPFVGLSERAKPLSLVHPGLYLMKVKQAQSVQEEHDQLLALLRSGDTFSVVHHPNGQLTITRTN
ncbi:MAG TPA: methyltransferase domain-containing protein [Gemmataceae bacterium]|jgi:SAM-dependent methyltransferase